jgi:mannose-6-phosphate isomerase-like protein (cupin superfamily)
MMYILSMTLSKKIQYIRKKILGLTVEEMHKKIISVYGNDSISIWAIRNIERGRYKESRLKSLEQICTGLGITMKELYEGVERDTVEVKPHIKRSKRPGRYAYNSKANYEIVTPSNLPYHIIELILEPGGKTLPRKEVSEVRAIDIVFVLQGKITCHVDGMPSCELKKGDSYTFDPHNSYVYENKSESKSVFTVFQDPKRY